MQIISRSIDRKAAVALPDIEADARDVLFLDIETTGLKRAENRVFLIGCICLQQDGWHMTQWFDDTGLEEKKILLSFLLFSEPFRYVINYKGNRFDLPFLRARFEANGLQDAASGFLSMNSIDLYGYIAPFRHILGLPDYRQQTVEAAVGISRQETLEKTELLEAYKKYLALPSADLMEKIVLHNEENAAGLLPLLSLSEFSRLEDMKVNVRRAQANYYTDQDKRQAEELVVSFDVPFSLPMRIYAGLDHCYLKISGENGILKIPLYTEEMKYYYANYKDYYYLPGDDMAVHKYIASYVDRSRRVQARPETCYTRKHSSYLPQWKLYRTPFFKRSYESSDLFFEFTDQFKKDRQLLSDYASYVLRHIIFRE